MPLFRELKKPKISPRIVLVGNFGAGNFGDELILAGFLRRLTNELPHAKITVLAANPKKVQQWHNVKAEKFLPSGIRSFICGKWQHSLQTIRKADAIIFPGGGLFTDSESSRAIFLWGIHLIAARFFWRPVFLIGQSVGPFRHQIAKKLTTSLLSRAEWINCRDTATAVELRQMGIPQKNIKRGFDSALWLANRLPKTKPLKKRGVKKILISVRSFPTVSKKFFIELTRALDMLTKNSQVQISFAEFGRGDTKVWQKIKNSAQNSRHWKIIKLPPNTNGILQCIKKFDLVIGMRLHSLIAAKLTGVPTISLAYSRKISAFSKKSLSIKNFNAEKLIKFLD